MKPPLTTPSPMPPAPPAQAESHAAPEGQGMADASGRPSAFRDLLGGERASATGGRKTDSGLRSRDGISRSPVHSGDSSGNDASRNRVAGSAAMQSPDTAAGMPSALSGRTWQAGLLATAERRLPASISAPEADEGEEAPSVKQSEAPSLAVRSMQAEAVSASVLAGAISAQATSARTAAPSIRAKEAAIGLTAAGQRLAVMERESDPAMPLPAAPGAAGVAGTGKEGASTDAFRQFMQDRSTGKSAHRPFELPGWRALKAEVAESGQQRHFAPAMPSLPLSFTSAAVADGPDGMAIATQALEGLEPALAQAAEPAAQHRQPAALTVRTLEIRLHPEHLGAIAAHIERRGDTLEVTLRASRRDVAEELEKTAHHLADRLQAAAGHATRVQLHIAVLPPAAAAEPQQANAQGSQQQENTFTQHHAGPEGEAGRQQPGGQHHAQQRQNPADTATGDGSHADGGAADGRAVRGLYL